MNIDALRNAVENVNAVVDPIKIIKRESKKKMMVRKLNLMKQSDRRTRSGVNVLCCMFVTFAVFHLDKSELNLSA